MGFEDKVSNKVEALKGRSKEAAGRATDDPELEADGRLDRKKADLKDVGEKVKDVFEK